jgi:hypothetical protein
MCKKKTSNEARPKGEWFNQPINLVKIASKDGATNNTKCYERVDKTFQSTSLCNIFAVNVLDECVMYVWKRERGPKEKKIFWGIKMNNARELYLSNYS